MHTSAKTHKIKTQVCTKTHTLTEASSPHLWHPLFPQTSPSPLTTHIPSLEAVMNCCQPVVFLRSPAYPYIGTLYITPPSCIVTGRGNYAHWHSSTFLSWLHAVDSQKVSRDNRCPHAGGSIIPLMSPRPEYCKHSSLFCRTVYHAWKESSLAMFA